MINLTGYTNQISSMTISTKTVKGRQIQESKQEENLCLLRQEKGQFGYFCFSLKDQSLKSTYPI